MPCPICTADKVTRTEEHGFMVKYLCENGHVYSLANPRLLPGAIGAATGVGGTELIRAIRESSGSQAAEALISPDSDNENAT